MIGSASATHGNRERQASRQVSGEAGRAQGGRAATRWLGETETEAAKASGIGRAPSGLARGAINVDLTWDLRVHLGGPLHGAHGAVRRGANLRGIYRVWH